MKFKALVASIGVFAISVANAGEIDAKAPITVEEPLGGTISTGYMTNYIFYGLDLGENAIWTGVDYTITQLPVDLNVGVWYVNPTDNPGRTGVDDKLDLYAGVAGPSFAGFDTSLTFTAFLFPELGSGSTYELAAGVSRSLGIVDMAASAHYDFELEAWYFEVGVEKSFDITDTIALVASAGVSYAVDYYTPGNGFQHAYAQLALPIALRSNVTLEPYVAGLFALDTIEDIQDDIIHGGISLSVSF